MSTRWRTYDRKSSVFTGKIGWVQIDVGKDDHDHFISAEERLNLAMMRQLDTVEASPGMRWSAPPEQYGGS